MEAKPRKPVRKKPASKSGRNKPTRKPVSKKASRKPVRKKPASKRVSQKTAPQGRYKAEPISTQIEATTNDSPDKIEPSAEFRRTKAALWRRWRAVGNSREFIWETLKLKWKFKRVYEDNPDLVRQFFRPTFMVTLVNSQELERRVRRLRDKEFRSLLRRYVDYAVRYGVVFQLFQRAPYFRVREGQGVVEDRFQVVVRADGFEPRGYLPPDTAFPDGFESDAPATPPELERLVKDGRAKYVLIDDEEPFSLLRQMFSFAYSPNHVTVFRYRSQPKYTLFVVGQNVPLAKVWPGLRKVIGADQRSFAKRDQRGKAPDLRRVHAMLNTILRGKGSQIERAARFVPEFPSSKVRRLGYPERLGVIESQLSQMKRRLDE